MSPKLLQVLSSSVIRNTTIKFVIIVKRREFNILKYILTKDFEKVRNWLILCINRICHWILQFLFGGKIGDYLAEAEINSATSTSNSLAVIFIFFSMRQNLYFFFVRKEDMKQRVIFHSKFRKLQMCSRLIEIQSISAKRH
jgi:hypothetical protein